jgi:hypothetical protein
MNRKDFWLGTHRARHLEESPVPLMVTVASLLQYAHGRPEEFPKGRVQCVFDSGGYSQLSLYGEWTITPDDFGGAVYRFMDNGIMPTWVAPQDWMCEPEILAKTGLTERIHQELTTESVLYLRENFPHANWITVVQGGSPEAHLAHVEMYREAGIDLTKEHIVGLGSVCRQQSTKKIVATVSTLHAAGLRLHGFGVKRTGLAQIGHMLASADSLAWSYTARREQIRLDGCTHQGLCNNCLTWALQWREDTLAILDRPTQLGLDLSFAA